MGTDTSEGGKEKRYKKDFKKRKPVKKHTEDLNRIKTQPLEEDKDNGEIKGMRNQKHSEEEVSVDSGDDKEKRDDSKKQLIGKHLMAEFDKTKDKGSVIAKSSETPPDVVVEERIKLSDSEEWSKDTERSFAPSLVEMLKHKNEKIRIEAIKSLLNIGDKSVCYVFASSMRDESFQVRLRALRGLYKYAGDRAAEYLIKALEDSHPDVRRRAVIYLGWLKKKEYVPYITGALADSSPLVRKVTTYTLGDLKDDSAVPHLIKALDDTDFEVKKGTLTALKRITKKSFDSDVSSSGEDHQEMVAKWKEWWKSKNKG